MTVIFRQRNERQKAVRAQHAAAEQAATAALEHARRASAQDVRLDTTPTEPEPPHLGRLARQKLLRAQHVDALRRFEAQFDAQTMASDEARRIAAARGAQPVEAPAVLRPAPSVVETVPQSSPQSSPQSRPAGGHLKPHHHKHRRR